ncbi:MAG: TIGR03032 family protein [Microcoleaceae cyanobacterium]
MVSFNQNKINSEIHALRSVHTTNFPHLLNQLGISLVISTYQAGKLIVIRPDGETINTHFRQFKKPMGIAADNEKLAVGTGSQIWDLRNVPAAANKLEPVGKHDACFIPRSIYMTGDIDIHEMAWVKDELWFINTRFSCLCTLGHPNSFVPRWRPNFITGYDLTDRCHLNGLSLKNGKPKYVTALGETDTPAGWRQNKADGGILIDIETNHIISRGISMPHSPRWYGEQLWVLESGKGSLVAVDLNNGNLTTITKLPGFTRGFDVWGNLAFIGLSQVRETAVFSGMEITQLNERNCGIWVVNLQTGETVAFLRFEAGVQEIFAVSVLPNIRFPEIIDWNEDLIAGTYILPDEALAEVIQPQPENIESEKYFVQGNQLYHQGKIIESIESYRKCLKLKPDFLQARYHLGVALGDTEQYTEAIQVLKQVIEVDKNHAEAHNSLGYVYSQQRQLQDAIIHYGEAVRLNGSYAKARHNLGMTLLQTGEFERGFAESEWRWKTENFTPFECPQPKWNGEDISDKTLLIHTEQGAGDAIQFIRYIPLVKQRCQRIILVCTESLKPLFETVEGIDQIMTAGDISLSAFDVYCPLMSLPNIFKTTLDTIPADIPYLKVTSKLKLKTSKTKFNVGIVWAGSPTHKNDKNRSCKITDFLPIIQLPNITLYSLQKGEKSQELQLLSNPSKVKDLESQLNTYAETAAIINQLDLIIGVDTSVVHVAGALGKPVWTLLCYNPDWRWLLDREDTPWYPTMRLFRASQPGDWAGVMTQVQQALGELAGVEIPIEKTTKTAKKKS